MQAGFQPRWRDLRSCRSRPSTANLTALVVKNDTNGTVSVYCWQDVLHAGLLAEQQSKGCGGRALEQRVAQSCRHVGAPQGKILVLNFWTLHRVNQYQEEFWQYML